MRELAPNLRAQYGPTPTQGSSDPGGMFFLSIALHSLTTSEHPIPLRRGNATYLFGAV